MEKRGASVSFFSLQSSAQTDADGRFDLSGLPSESVGLWAWHPAYLYSPVENVVAGSETRLVLADGARVTGKVRRRVWNDFPLAVRLDPDPRFSHPGRMFSSLEVAIGADGSFAFDHVASGRVTIALVAAEEQGFQPILYRRSQDVVEGATAAVDVEVADVRVRGRLLQNGRSVPGAQVTLEGMTEQDGRIDIWTERRYLGANIQPGSTPERLRATAGADGRYEMIVPVPGRYRLRYWVPGTEKPSIGREVEIPNAASFDLDLDLDLPAPTPTPVAK
jgi:hypothetical protein